MVGVALLTGLRRGELFALRWKAVDLETGTLTVQRGGLRGHVRHAEDGGRAAGLAVVAGCRGVADGVAGAGRSGTSRTTWCLRRSGKPISPNNVLRRWVFPACEALGLARTQLADVPAHLLVLGARATACRARWSPS